MTGPRFTKASVVGAQHARATWALAAREHLIVTAKRYHEVVTYTELGDFVQNRSLISTSASTGTWIADVLRRVAAECSGRGEPNLAALCVNAKGSVGDSYARLVAEAYGATVTEPDEHAAHARLECHRHFGADLPEGGGEPAMPPSWKAPAVRTERAPSTRSTGTTTKRAAASEEKPPAICPTCFTALPATGICDYCD